MDSRRDFLKKAGLLATAGALPASVVRALGIEPEPGSTWRDAEHVVILMQENRSFDHCYGSLSGVRGFNDPRAVTLPDGNPVWLQSNAAGETFVPFRLDLKDSRTTWMGCLPHGWSDQSKARNDGYHDRWLDQKKSGQKAYAGLPLTLGYHTREDLPFYYALADAFTVCDQNFCSSLTGTTPNRLHLWSGTIRPSADPAAKAHVRNGDADHRTEVSWKTFPERLEEHGISWCVYQNELTIETGLTGDEDSWLANFGDNPLEYFTQYHVRFCPRHRAFLTNLAQKLEAMEQTPRTAEALLQVRSSIEKWSEANFAALPEREQHLHRKAFVTNEGDPRFRELEPVPGGGDSSREMNVPRGDVLHQFRRDVNADKLPAVSWMVAPQMFSDHPDSPWYGAWYISEVLDILTSRPEVWKKTIFILCYDENDGYFDHVPPFIPPDPDQPDSGKASAGLDPGLEYVREAQEKEHLRKYPRDAGHTGPIGLGYRVPLVIASPWSRGGTVCSQVFDHTSILQFLEKFLSHKTGRKVEEPSITPWRRAVCGDLTSAFGTAGADSGRLKPVERDGFFNLIRQAKSKPLPQGGTPLTPEEVKAARRSLPSLGVMPRQENGTRPACALPYELSAEGSLSADRGSFIIHFAAGRGLFGDRAAGSPFHVYIPGPFNGTGQPARTRAYAVKAGDRLADSWALADFAEGGYHLCVHGPNGFFREFRGTAGDPVIEIRIEPVVSQASAPVGVAVTVASRDALLEIEINISDVSYQAPVQTLKVAGGTAVRQLFPLTASHGWYDLRITAAGFPAYGQRFAGRVETGRESRTDPLMGGALG